MIVIENKTISDDYYPTIPLVVLAAVCFPLWLICLPITILLWIFPSLFFLCPLLFVAAGICLFWRKEWSFYFMGGVSVLWIGTTIEFWDASEMYVLLCIYLGCISVLSLWGILAFRWHRSTVTIHKTTEYAE